MAEGGIRKIVSDKGFMARAERWVLYSMLGFVGVFAVAAILSGGEEVLVALKRISPLEYGVLLGLSLLNYVGRALRWQLFTRKLDIRIPFGRNTLYYIAGFSMTATPAKAGEALRLWFMKRAHKVRYANSLNILVADRLSDMGGTLILVSVSVALYDAYWWVTLGAAGATVAVTLFFMRPQLGIMLINWMYARVERSPRLFAQARHMMRQSARLASVPTYSAALVLAVAGWFAEAFAFYLLLDILGAPIALGEAVFIFGFAMLVGAAAMLPGGLGGTEATMFALLVALGVPAEIAIAATAVIRSTTLWFAILLGFIVLPATLRRVRADEMKLSGAPS